MHPPQRENKHKSFLKWLLGSKYFSNLIHFFTSPGPLIIRFQILNIKILQKTTSSSIKHFYWVVLAVSSLSRFIGYLLKYVFLWLLIDLLNQDDAPRKYEGLSETAAESNLIYLAWHGSDIYIKAAAKYWTHDHRIL